MKPYNTYMAQPTHPWSLMHALIYLFVFLLKKKKLPKVHMAIGLGPNHPHPFERFK
jgi:hypothetical protein